MKPDSENAAENQPESPEIRSRRRGKAASALDALGLLATLVPESGSPFATLVNVASAPDGSPILLISQLSAHRKHIAADPRVSLLLLFAEEGRSARASAPDPKRARDPWSKTPAERANLRARFLARHPKSALYADFPDFAFFRVELESVHMNGGFGRAAPGIDRRRKSSHRSTGKGELDRRRSGRARACEPGSCRFRAAARGCLRRKTAAIGARSASTPRASISAMTRRFCGCRFRSRSRRWPNCVTRWSHWRRLRASRTKACGLKT